MITVQMSCFALCQITDVTCVEASFATALSSTLDFFFPLDKVLICSPGMQQITVSSVGS